MSMNHEQDLVFFKDNTLIPDTIINGPKSYLQIIAYVEGTQPTWMVNSLIESSLTGTAALVNKDLTRPTPRRSHVVYISFSNSFEFYHKGCKKNGIDLSRESFQFIDCFSDLFVKHLTEPGRSEKQMEKLFQTILNQIQDSKPGKKVIFIENPEFLLSATDISSSYVANFLVKLNRLCCNLFVIANHTFPQIVDTTIRDEFDPVSKTTDLLVKLHQRAHSNIYIEPLTTGRAKDVTGILTISKGSLPFPSNIVLDEKSYIYNVSKESNIKLYFR